MLNKLLKFMRQQDMVVPGDTVICAVSGGADSVALLFALYLLKEKLGIRLEAAHFNHQLRQEESDRDEAFVRAFCERYEIPLHLGRGQVTAGKKGLEAAARDARYAFLRGLAGKIATAHTADDNAETVLLHLVRGTGLKGLGGITPVRGNVIRPMLMVTRQDVEAFLAEWGLDHVEDSSNGSDTFLRNRLRHHVMPLLAAENPQMAENLSRMALRLRADEDCLSGQAQWEVLPEVEVLKTMHPALRSRVLETFLRQSGVKEPEEAHILRAEALVFSENPSAWADFPGGVRIGRCYTKLEVRSREEPQAAVILPCPGEADFGRIHVVCAPAVELKNTPDILTVIPEGTMILRAREAGDEIRLPGGRKSLKKLFIDRKIPAALRGNLPVLADERGILGVCSIGANQDRAAAQLPAVTVRFQKIENKGE